MKKLIPLILILFSLKGFTQSKQYYRADSSFFQGNPNATLIIQSATRTKANSWLHNIGNGVSQWDTLPASGNLSLYIPYTDTLNRRITTKTYVDSLLSANTLYFSPNFFNGSGTLGSPIGIDTAKSIGKVATFSDVALKANIASPTFTGTVTIPTPFTLGAISVTSTGTQLNYLNAATGTTGTVSSSLVYSATPTITNGTITNATLSGFPSLAILKITGRVTKADIAYTMGASDYQVAYTSITAPRAVTLPSAASCPNTHFEIIDESGSVTSTNKITIVGTVNGASNPDAITTAYGGYFFYSNGTAFFTENGFAAGLVPVANGGTGISSYTTGDLLYASSSSVLSKLAIGATGKKLTVVAGIPAWIDSVASSRLIPTAVKTANYSAVINDFVPCDDSTTASFTVTLPSAPADGSAIGVKIVIHTTARTVTIAAGGTDKFNRASGVTSFNLTLLNQAVIMQYKSSTGIWYVTSTDAPISAFISSTGSTGDLISFSSANTPSNISAVAAGSYLRSAGTSTLPVWSTTTLPNSATTGDLLSASASNVYSNVAAVASGSILASAGTSTLPTWSASPTLTTSLTVPLITGGTGTTSTLTFKTTTGVGTTNADMVFQVGNNGATEAMRILNSGKVNIGTGTLSSLLLQVGAGTLPFDAGIGIAAAGTESGLVIAQDGTHGIIFNWAYNATPANAKAFIKTYGGTNPIILQSDGGIVGIGQTSPSAVLHIKAGTATASTAPGKIDPGLKLTTAENGAIESDTTGGVYHLYWTNKSLARLQLDNSGVSNYFHTIFTPTTGQTITTINNQYNIVNPAGALLALTVNLPSSPANNDVVYIKFTQTITTVTYANGTVVDGIAGPAAGGLVVLTYDSGTTSWY